MSQRTQDVGSGTGVLTEAIVEIAAPRQVVGIDRSEGYVAYARRRVEDRRVRFVVGDAQDLALTPESFDAAVSSLVLNFVPDPQVMVSSMARVTRAGGIVACYVWDYLDRMQIMRSFWRAAAELDPSVAELPEVRRYSMCRPESLTGLFIAAGLECRDSQIVQRDSHE